MQQNLVIVESPAKAKTIEKFLGKEFKVMSSYGHIRDLKKKEISIDPKTLDPCYEVPEEKKKLVSELKRNVEQSKTVWLASDEDREGEAIAWHLCEVLGLDEDKTNRIVFHEITKPAILHAIETPRQLDMNLVNAQQARRVLDRLVGFKLSPVLWRKVKPALSAGRVQSVAVRLIVEREREIQAFKSEPYYRVNAIFVLKDGEGNVTELKAELDKRFKSHEEAVSFLEKSKNSTFQIASIAKKPLKRMPAPPFTTSTLQQEAARKLGFTVSQTMMVAQRLYEGGHITYMRTDSVRISDEAKKSAHELISHDYGDEYLGNNLYVNKKKDVQDAHEAIRPSDPQLKPEDIKAALTSDQYKLYNLIWSRFVASQMSSAVYDAVSADIMNGEYLFRASGSRLKFKGYLAVYNNSSADDDKKMLPPLDVAELLKNIGLDCSQHFTQPPARFSEAGLIKELEEKNIGRPSTYAPIVGTLSERKYVKREKKILIPTELGMTVNELMETYFENIVDAGFTAVMEDRLDSVELGNADWRGIISEFYTGFEKELLHADESIEKVVIEDTPTGEFCPTCGKPLVIKQGRFGDFIACSGYPDCKTTMPIMNSIGVSCPLCGKDIVQRRGKSGKIFYGCSGYPDCKNVYWNKPVDKKCSKCGSLMTEKKSKNYAYICSNSECGHKEAE